MRPILITALFVTLSNGHLRPGPLNAILSHHLWEDSSIAAGLESQLGQPPKAEKRQAPETAQQDSVKAQQPNITAVDNDRNKTALVEEISQKIIAFYFFGLGALTRGGNLNESVREAALQSALQFAASLESQVDETVDAVLQGAGKPSAVSG